VDPINTILDSDIRFTLGGVERKAGGQAVDRWLVAWQRPDRRCAMF
jgi:hypothetical protein